MALSAGTIEDELQRRLNIGTAEKGITDADLFEILDKVQASMIYGLKRRLSAGTLTLTSGTVLYIPTTSLDANCQRVVTLYESSRTIPKLGHWYELAQNDRNWLQGGKVSSGEANAIQCWAESAPDLIAVNPALATGSTLSATFVKESTITLDSSGDLLVIPDHDAELVYDLCEVVWLAHLRLYAECANKSERLAEHITKIVGGRT